MNDRTRLLFACVLLLFSLLMMVFGRPAAGQSVMSYPTFTITQIDGDDWSVRAVGLTPIPAAPPEFYDYYAEMIDCSGVENPPPYFELRWYGATALFEMIDGEVAEMWAVFFKPPPEIILTTIDPVVVKHELHHYVTGSTDDAAAQACAEGR